MQFLQSRKEVNGLNSTDLVMLAAFSPSKAEVVFQVSAAEGDANTSLLAALIMTRLSVAPSVARCQLIISGGTGREDAELIANTILGVLNRLCPPSRNEKVCMQSKNGEADEHQSDYIYYFYVNTA